MKRLVWLATPLSWPLLFVVHIVVCQLASLVESIPYSCQLLKADYYRWRARGRRL